MRTNSINLVKFGDDKFITFPKIFLEQHGIKKGTASHIVDKMVKDRVSLYKLQGNNNAQAMSVIQVFNFFQHLSKTPSKIQTFIDNFCEKFPLPKN